MAYSKNALAEKLYEMYPEIKTHGIDMAMNLDQAKGAWVVTLTKGKHNLSTFLEIKDADACMEGSRCVYLGHQVGQFVRNFEGGE